MLSGRVDGAGPDLAHRNHTWLAIALLAAVLTFWVWQWQDNPDGLSSGHGQTHAQSHDRSHDEDD